MKTPLRDEGRLARAVPWLSLLLSAVFLAFFLASAATPASKTITTSAVVVGMTWFGYLIIHQRRTPR